MKNAFLAAVLALASSWPAVAHEFWLWPTPFAPAAGGDATLEMYVGEQFSGERIGFSTAHAAAMRVYTVAGVQSLRERLPDNQVLAELPLKFARAGTHLIAFDSQPSMLTLSADKFHAYLHDEGLDAIIRQREQAGTAGTPGRERYRRQVKTLLHVGARSDGTYAARTGQRLEILPLADPLSARAGDTLGFRLMFDDKPLAGALVKAWHKHDGQTMVIRAHSGTDGKVRFTLPYGGPWMISVVHMIQVNGETDIDWDSFWGNLTFALSSKRRAFAPGVSK